MKQFVTFQCKVPTKKESIQKTRTFHDYKKKWFHRIPDLPCNPCTEQVLRHVPPDISGANKYHRLVLEPNHSAKMETWYLYISCKNHHLTHTLLGLRSVQAIMFLEKHIFSEIIIRIHNQWADRDKHNNIRTSQLQRNIYICKSHGLAKS